MSIDFIPPSQADEPSSGDIFQIVEIHGEQDDGDDEDHDEVGCEEHAEEVDEETGCGGVEGRLRSIVSLQVVWEKRERERGRDWRTDSEGEEGQEGDGMCTQSPVELARSRIDVGHGWRYTRDALGVGLVDWYRHRRNVHDSAARW